MIQGIQHLKDLRLKGKKPAYLEVDVSCQYLPPKYACEFERMVLMASGDLTSDDFRPFFGLDVVLFAPETDKTFAQLIEKMKQYASRITVLCGEYGEDIGFEWSKKWGPCDLGETYWADRWDEARKATCRTNAEVEKRLKVEAEALAHCPWIPERMLPNGTATV